MTRPHCTHGGCGIEHTHGSHLEDFRTSTRLYYETHVAKTTPKKQTEAMALGTLFHQAIMEPDQQVVLGPDVGKRTKAWAAFASEHEGKTIAHPEDLERVLTMKRALERSNAAMTLLELDGQVEHEIAWNHSATGFPMRGRLDKVIGKIVIDLKTSSDPSPKEFAKSVANYGYHRKMALYLDWLKVSQGIDGAAVFIVVGSKPPHDVAVYELDPAAVEYGANQSSETLVHLRECIETGDWTPPHERRSTVLELPPWAYGDEVWDVWGAVS